MKMKSLTFIQKQNWEKSHTRIRIDPPFLPKKRGKSTTGSVKPYPRDYGELQILSEVQSSFVDYEFQIEG